MNRSMNYFKKLKGMNKWDSMLPYIFIVYLFSVLAWQLHSLSSISNWLDRTDKILWNLRNLDSFVLESHNNLRGYQLTKNEDYLDGVLTSRRNMEQVLQKLQAQSKDEKVILMSKEFEEGFIRWNNYADKVISLEVRGQDTREMTLRRTGLNLIRPMRELIDQTIDEQLRQRALKKEALETGTMRLFFGSSVGLLLLSLFFVRIMARNKKWALALQESEQRYRQMLESATLAEARFRGLLESAYDLILISDNKGIIQFVNYQLCLKTGYSREELVGRAVEKLIPHNYLDRFYQFKENYINSPESKAIESSIELFIKKKDNQESPVEVTLSPFRTHGTFQIAAIIRDISERKTFEKRQAWLAEIGSILNTTLEPKKLIRDLGIFCLGKLADWCAVIPHEGDITVMREREKDEVQILEFERSSYPLIERLFELIRNEDFFLESDISESRLRELSFTEDQIRQIQMMGIKSVLICPLIGRDHLLGAVVHVRTHKNYLPCDLDFVHDITSRAALALDNARLYELAQNSIKIRDELLRIVSHDLKNPLTSIKLNIQMLQKELEKQDGDEGKLKRVIAVEKSVDKAIDLIQDLLESAKIETGGLELHKERINVTDLIQETESMFSSLAEERGIQLRFNLEGSNFRAVEADPERVHQVISNLMGNALKYTSSGGTISLKIKEGPTSLLISVSDNGPGIEEENQKKLFQKYWKDKEGKGHNLGLGLAIAKGLVEAHGGKIWVESKINQGTTFYFTLPYEFHGIRKTYHNDKNNIISI